MPMNSTNPGLLGGIGVDGKIQELTKRYGGDDLSVGLIPSPPGLFEYPQGTIRSAPKNRFGGLISGALDTSMDSGLPSMKSDNQIAREAANQALGLGPESMAMGSVAGGRGAGLFKGLIGLLPSKRRFKAFHGSPHDFDKFSSSRIGTGEGRQAYGEGLYFAQDPAIAKYYKKVLSGDSGKGSLYKVKIKGNKNAFLDHDKNFIHQTKEVQDSIYAAYAKAEKKLGIDPSDIQRKKPAFGRYVKNDNPVNNEDTRLRMLRLMGGEEIYSRLAIMLGSSEAATKALKDAGIPGVKYFDGNKIRSLAQGKRGVGASNFVVFDDKTIKIIKKYGIAGLMAGGAGAGLIGGNSEATQ